MMNALCAFMKNSLREFEKAGRNFLAALACPGEDGRLERAVRAGGSMA
jgi:hypothetical protein